MQNSDGIRGLSRDRGGASIQYWDLEDTVRTSFTATAAEGRDGFAITP
jgi:hypothetical protein